MSVEIKNIGEFQGKVSAWIESVKQATVEASVGLAHEAFEQILETGPQYSGDFVANTKVDVGQPVPAFEPDAVHHGTHNPFKMGDAPAQAYARSRAVWAVPKIGQSVFVHSTAQHDELYSWKIEKGLIALRDVNEGADWIYTRAAMYVAHDYKYIGRVQMDSLRKASA